VAGVSQEPDAAAARAIIDANLYMTLGTADRSGRPWVSPVYFSAEGYSEFFWVSSPEATHSRNLAARSEVSIVIFDSQVPISTGQGVYMSATAEEVADAERDRGLGIFSRRTQEHGKDPWTREDVEPPAHRRLYRAIASEHFVLDSKDQRRPVNPGPGAS
jgi:nitroimidazol reductase NimA-like FMN-containing flavoprotein (pyridoxamine 5'-phosphate oxidase superfamily)